MPIALPLRREGARQSRFLLRAARFVERLENAFLARDAGERGVELGGDATARLAPNAADGGTVGGDDRFEAFELGGDGPSRLEHALSRAGGLGVAFQVIHRRRVDEERD